MTENAFTIKRNDTSPAIQYALPTGIVLSGATVRFLMAPRGGGAVKVDEAATIATESPPVLQYDWAAADTDAAGLFNAEFQVTYSDSTIETFPNDRMIEITIAPDL